MASSPTAFHLRVQPAAGLKRPRESSLCLGTTWTLLLVLRNASLSVVFAWLAAFGLSLGSVITNLSVAKQTTMDFAVSVLTVSKFLNWVFVIATHAALLLQHPRVRALPLAQRPGALRCALTIAWKTMPGFLALNIATLVLGVLVYHLSPSVRRTKVHVYITLFLMHLDTIVASLATQSAFLEHAESIGRLAGPQGDATANAIAPSAASEQKQPRRARPRSYAARFMRLFRQLATSLLATHIAAAYAQFAARLPLHSQEQMGLFTLASVVLKVLLQELTRHYVLHRRLQSARVMAVIVGIPTIAIDTQMRIVLLRAHNTRTQLSGSFAMAVIEVLVRLVKTHIVHNQIRSQERARGLRSARASIAQRATDLMRRVSSRTNGENATETAIAPSQGRRRLRQSPSLLEFEGWKTRLLRHHATEVYLDMLSEYVAMGCAYAVLIVFWAHPKYLLAVEPGHAILSTDASMAMDEKLTMAQLQLWVVGVQMALEIVVDFVSCVLAALNGVNMALLESHSLFMAFFLIWAAVGNVIISANMLLRDDAS
ncbi:hypothetical protein BBJ28_00013201 [Nothophytophthora sp. Chile5]|nr:hypothetical protein BBJ28_00013201 [Nothophytophthora sp. Chile5]